MNKISVVINTLNEELFIEQCISSVKFIADEIIVCDMYSDDQTVAIAESLGAKVVYHERVGFVEPARHFAISQAANEWVLVLDADEKMTETLGNELKRIAKDDIADIVMFASLFNYFGQYIKHGGFFNNNWARFFKKETYIKVYSSDEEMVHCNFSNLRKSSNRKITLSKKYYILHEAYPTFEKFLRKGLCNYTLLESNLRFEKGEKITLFNAWFIPLKEFIKSYFIWKGYKDGKIGLTLCYLKAQHTFYIYLNLWFLNRNK